MRDHAEIESPGVRDAAVETREPPQGPLGPPGIETPAETPAGIPDLRSRAEPDAPLGARISIPDLLRGIKYDDGAPVITEGSERLSFNPRFAGDAKRLTAQQVRS